MTGILTAPFPKLSGMTQSESVPDRQPTPNLSDQPQLSPLNSQKSPPAGGEFEILEVKTDLYQPLIEIGEDLPSEELLNNMLEEGSLFGEAGELWEQAVIALYEKHNIHYPGLPGEENITILTAI